MEHSFTVVRTMITKPCLEGHGIDCHYAAVFRKIFPFAHSRNLRLVLVNCRDYPGSTRYSSKELEGFSSSQKAVQAETLRARGIEFAAFIRWFIEIHHVPPISEQPGSNSPSGGISLLGWSSGNLQTIPLLAYATDLPEDTTNLLERYFRHFTIYGTLISLCVDAPLAHGAISTRYDNRYLGYSRRP